MAEGTLLMNWHDNALNNKVFLLRRLEKNSRTKGILDIFPENVNKNTNVKSRG